MRTLTLTALFTLILSASAMAFSLPKVDGGQVNLNACLLQEAKQSLAKGTLTPENINEQAEAIAKVCAAKLALQNDSETVKLAVTVINNLLK